MVDVYGRERTRKMEPNGWETGRAYESIKRVRERVREKERERESRTEKREDESLLLLRTLGSFFFATDRICNHTANVRISPTILAGIIFTAPFSSFLHASHNSGQQIYTVEMNSFQNARAHSLSHRRRHKLQSHDNQLDDTNLFRRSILAVRQYSFLCTVYWPLSSCWPECWI